MKLKSFRIKEFRSIRDTGPVEVDDITCLVGKNEAGKTAILQALYRLNPIIEADGAFDVTDDYPRKDVSDYEDAVENKEREPAKVVEAKYALEEADISEITKIFGEKAVGDKCLRLSKRYPNQLDVSLGMNEDAARQHLLETAALSEELKKELLATDDWAKAREKLESAGETGEITQFKSIIDICAERGTDWCVWDKILKDRTPKLLYFDEYYQMKGHENVNALIERQGSGKLKNSDRPLLGLINLARLDLKKLLEAKRTEELINKLEGAGNHLTQKIQNYWSQNQHIRLKFDLRKPRPEDPEGMHQGMNIWGRVYNDVHQATTGLGAQSKGFLWFFSFLAWYEDEKRKGGNLILLLDEPGLSLHGLAQGDLLQYIEQALAKKHQIIYSTHSPFMVDPDHFERVRIVQDLSMDAKKPLSGDEGGTKVLKDVFTASEGSLFPLQGALGYDICQTLFIGPNTLVVEGVSDMLYLQNMSALLERSGRKGLNRKWTITPVGGSSKVPAFVALLGAQKGMNIAVLVDVQASDRQSTENLYKQKLLKENQVLTCADFVEADEADIEDLFDRKLYVGWVNEEFKSDLPKPIKVTDLNEHQPRIVRALEAYFKKNLPKQGRFGHYRPARYFSDNFAEQSGKIDDATKDRFVRLFGGLNKLLK